MSGQLPGGSPTNHSLAFRVMRLCRPTFQAEDAVLQLDPFDLLAGEDLFDDPRVSPHLLDRFSSGSVGGGGDFSFRDRFQLRNPIDAMALSGNLILPQSFGAIYLGETFCSYISINNSSNFEARDVVIKAEIQTGRQTILLLDTSKSPVETIRSGGRYDFIVEHDVKELGPHTLVCTALYNDGDGERKYLPQFFKFVVANPLSVRTKVRIVKENTFLEACIENHTKSNLYMDQVEFEPAQHWIATRLEADEHASEINSRTRGIFRSPVLIRAGGGIHNYLYQLRLLSQESGHAKVDGGNILGKLQITWRTNLGEPGRLQTQQIHGTPIAPKDIDVQIVEVPSVIILERPFLHIFIEHLIIDGTGSNYNFCLTLGPFNTQKVHLGLKNHTDRTVGPFEVWVSRGIASEEKVVMINGIQKLVVQPVEAFESAKFSLNLIATRLGVQKISGITVFDAHQKKLYDPLPEMEIFVDTD